MNERLLREVTGKDAGRIKARARYLRFQLGMRPSRAMSMAVRDFGAGWPSYAHFKFVGRKSMTLDYLQEYGL